MKEQNFEWLLQGCHALSEVAVAYFPDFSYNSSAVRGMRRSVNEHSELKENLEKAGFTAHTTLLTPQQIAAIIRSWGMPTEVRDMIEKNSYLAVPKIVEKI